MVHPDIGIRLAATSSKKSRNYTDKKDYGETEGMEEFAAEKIKNGFDYVIMGQRHKLVDKLIGNGRYINLGHWFKDPSYAVFNGKEMQIKSVTEFVELD